MKGKEAMTPLPLETIASRLASTLQLQDAVGRHVMRRLWETGAPIAPADLAALTQMSPKELAAHLSPLADIEFDAQSRIVGWGLTLVPTRHRLLRPEQVLYTWCAFDTVLVLAVLQQSARVQSSCAATGEPISFEVMAAGTITEQLPHQAHLSLVLPHEQRQAERSLFCVQSLFFASEQAAGPWLAAHPEAISLSLEEAMAVAQRVASLWRTPLV
jgi:alkylmercury lyase